MKNRINIFIAITMLLITSCGTLNPGSLNLPSSSGSSTNETNSAQKTTPAISEKEATNGLKEALNTGLQKSIQTLSKKDGFLGDAAVKILMPEEVKQVESALRAVGMGSLCDQFIKSMNGAAETAVQEASTVFLNSLSKLSVKDVFSILLSGQQNAATNYFKTNTSAELTSKFTPIIQGAMGKNNVTTYWNQLTTAYNKLPLSKKIETNLTAYVTQKAIDGLFIKVSEQELKIRKNIPGSRNTNTLQKVFGWADQQ